ncbi:MAG: ABC transporter substrate-binding protein [Thermodesulfovibrio sp.]|nr:ABC transporter substrate-binding protein [Thermodesulfovibrio sp.]MDW7997921.1 ABC transporter substrate-binding protein [Thermodesulfovibrio sp.]
MRYRFVLFAVIFILIIAFLIYTESTLYNEDIKIGTSYWLGYGFLYYLQDAKILDKNFEVIEFNSTSEVLRAYRNRLINSLCLTTDEVLRNYTENDPYTILIVLSVSEGADLIIARKDIKEPSALKGKRIGLENTALGRYMFKRFLEINKFDERDFFLVYVEPHEHYKSFAEGDIDAVITYEPIASRIISALGGNIIFSSKQIPGEVYDFVLVRRDFLLKNKKKIKDMINHYFEIIDEFKISNSDMYDKYLSENYKISMEKLHDIFNFDKIKFFDKKENRELLLKGELEQKLRLIEKYFSLKEPVDYSKLIDIKILNELYRE